MRFLKQKFFSRKLPAFSIVEALFSMVILTVGLLSTTLIVAKSLSYSFDTRDTIIGIQLAQEGAELIRNSRDNDFLLGNEGFTQFSNSKHCRASYDDDPASTLDCNSSQGGASRYSLVQSGGFYKHTGATGHFSRYIYVDLQNVASDPSAHILSFVYWDWTAGGFPSFIPSNGDPSGCTLQNKCVYTESYLTSWKN